MNPFPVTEHLLCAFVSYLADEGLTPQTGRVYLSALRSMQISLGLPDPRDSSSLPILKRVQAGISRSHAKKGVPTRIRLPITAHILSNIHDTLMASSNPEKHVIWAIAYMAFLGFLDWESYYQRHPVHLTQPPAWHGAMWQWMTTTLQA